MEGITPVDTVRALIAGGTAGTAVDIILFPLDTVKTRLQAEGGFWKSGGVRGIYSGLLSAALGSAPTAALFFVVYESTKSAFYHSFHKKNGMSMTTGHMAAASLGEVVACLIRVPVEVVKQRTQALKTGSSWSTFNQTLREEGFRGFYRGYQSTVMREIPFSVIQFPLWEFMKSSVAAKTKKRVTALESSMCGAVAGGISAALTTPLDVAKTRIMLAERDTPLARGGIVNAMKHVVRERGVSGLLSGMGPRVLWISVGGSIFLGIYEKVKITLSEIL